MLPFSFKKKALILGTVLSVLIITYILGFIFSPASIGKREAAAPLFPTFNKDIIEEMHIKTQEGSITLKKKKNSWTVLINGIFFPASVSRVDALLDQITALKGGKEITRNPDIWPDFEVENEQARRITLIDQNGGKVVNFLVGKTETSSRGNYIRIEGNDSVILLDRSLNSYLKSEGKFWSHLKLLPEKLKGRDIMRITVSSSLGFGYTLLQVQDEAGINWKVQDSEDITLSNSKVDNLANSLAGFEGTEFLMPGESGFFSSLYGEVIFSTIDNREYRLVIGEKVSEEDQYPVTLKGKNFSYLASEWRIKKILLPMEDLLN